jgi:formamidopyrimidine-DNA glycosylase
MPEGHTIHQLARDHRRLLRGRRLTVSSPQGRFAAGAAALDGQCLDGVDAYGKHLFYEWSSGDLLHVHLGLFGRFLLHRGEPPPPLGAIRVRLSAGDDDRPPVTLDLRGPTECGIGTPDDRAAVVARLGPDPLRADADPQRFYARAGRTNRAIGAVLLDQSVIAGLGNVYRSEVLFVCGVDPRRPGRDLSGDELACLWETARSMLRKGVRDKRIVTVDPGELDVRAGDGPRRGETTYVYHRPICLRCGSTIERFELGNRMSYACPVCQR